MSTIIREKTETRKTEVFLWTIEHFSELHFTQVKKIVSPLFESETRFAPACMDSSAGLQTFSWNLEFIPNFFGNSAFGFYPIRKEKIVSDTKPFTHTPTEIAVVNEDLENIFTIKQDQLNDCRVSPPLKGGGWSYFINVGQNLLKTAQQHPSRWLPNDALTIRIKIETVQKNLAPHTIDDAPKEEPKSQLISGLLSCLENEKFSDVILEVDGKEIKAHKMMLSIKSPVFSAMFNHESMKESKDNRVIIEDTDADVIKQMLEYIYTEKTPSNIDNCVHDLVGVAHKLKNKAVEFVEQNVSIIESAAFKNLEIQNANLAFEILRQLILNK
ncbi:TD and POZ domain-containing protein 3-like [Aphidius gifuensis]|uniref:TD and POZ domain-containing protein 3-like n=1 Tax=Aphidius gifuensis TaxID=684658 RepID=UPI001CDCD799|nr:TD and POZ domain-containing protein 3-like [Aphidius gifuensis]